MLIISPAAKDDTQNVERTLYSPTNNICVLRQFDFFYSTHMFLPSLYLYMIKSFEQTCLYTKTTLTRTTLYTPQQHTCVVIIFCFSFYILEHLTNEVTVVLPSRKL